MTRLTHSLRVINRIHAQLQLRVVWIPALRANLQLVQLGLDDLKLQLLQLKALPTPVALGNAVLTRGKPIAHLGGSPTNKLLPWHKPNRRFFPVFTRRQIKLLIVLIFEHLNARH